MPVLSTDDRARRVSVIKVILRRRCASYSNSMSAFDRSRRARGARTWLLLDRRRPVLMITYAAYAPPGVEPQAGGHRSVVADTGISCSRDWRFFHRFLLRARSRQWPGLVFVTLPIAFADMPFGAIAAVAFFILLLGGRIGIEPSRCWNSRWRHCAAGWGWSRPRASLIAAVRFVPSPDSPACLLVQYLVRLASARGGSRFRAGDDLRPAGRVDVKHHAALGRFCPGDLRRRGPAAANPRQGIVVVSHRRCLAASPAALCRARWNCRSLRSLFSLFF